MTADKVEPVSVTVDGSRRVSALLQGAQGARACYVLAHGAGAGMTHPFLTAFVSGLTKSGLATRRYQFPYMKQRSSRPDSPPVAHASARAAVAEASHLVPELALF